MIFKRSMILVRHLLYLRLPLKPLSECRFMSHKSIRELLNSDKSLFPLKCQTKGWVRNIRKKKLSVFLDLVDGTCSGNQKIQVILERNPESSNLNSYDAVHIEGNLKESPGHQQSCEILAEKFTKVSSSNMDYAIRVQGNLEDLRADLHLRPYHPLFASILRIRSLAEEEVHSFFRSKNFHKVHAPVVTRNDCEGGGEVFQVQTLKKENFFKSPAYLTVSSQLHLEALMGCLERVYTFGPTFRAENQRSRLHLSEFQMVEAELGFIYRLDELLDLAEELVKTVGANLLLRAADDIQLWPNAVKPDALEKPLKRLTYTEAVGIINSKPEKFSATMKWGDDLNAEHETFLMEYLSSAIIIIHYPKKIKPFYMKNSESDENIVENFDLLLPFAGEVCGGSLREHKIEPLRQKLQLAGLDESLRWYLELREFGSVPHGGFGLGFDRLLLYFLGLKNIRGVVPFPRWTEHCLM